MAIKDLTTEQRNPDTMNLDQMSTLDMVKAINQEDQKVAIAVSKQVNNIAKAIDLASIKFKNGGRLIYMGAGTSGRLGILDAVELVPTYGINPNRAIGLIAGGNSAIYKAVEGAEDSEKLGKQDLLDLKLTDNDVVIGLAASGRTPYVIGGLNYANSVGALTIAIACIKNSEIGKLAQVAIEAVVGPEAVTGSTRMKAGTAQKMILNMLSTGIMVKNGKVYQNIMIDVLPTNEKLVNRAQRIIMAISDVDQIKASKILKQADNNVPTAIVMAKMQVNKKQAQEMLLKHHGLVRDTLKI